MQFVVANKLKSNPTVAQYHANILNVIGFCRLQLLYLNSRHLKYSINMDVDGMGNEKFLVGFTMSICYAIAIEI